MAAAEQKKSYAVVKNFTSLNTKANRTAIKEDEFAWIENAMPIGAGNIKVTPSQSTIRDSGNAAVAFGNTVTALVSANIDVSDYVIGFQSNGAAQYFNVTTSTTGNITAAGTFSSSGVTTAQYKNQNVIIGDPDKGLFSWDGGNLSSIGSVGAIGITNAGAGYASTPSITISAPQETGGNVQATATVTIGSGVVTAITLTNGGQGYTATPTVTISGGGQVPTPQRWLHWSRSRQAQCLW